VIAKRSNGLEEKTTQQTQSKTQTVQQVQLYAYVDTDALNMRSSPSTQSDVVTILHKDDRVQLIEPFSSSSNWIKIRSGSYEGYASANYLRE
jgi:uncharacterized protein YgiM (DUF1202 family)